MKNSNKITVLHGDCRALLKSYPSGYFNLIVTSPPYADARKKHYDSVLPKDFADYFLTFHDELWRVLRDDGSFILNMKDKVVGGVRHRYVWRTLEKLTENGWNCIDDYIWIKPNAMPGFWPNRLRDEWEYCFHLTKSKRFTMYQEAVKRPIGDWARIRLKNLSGKSAMRHNSENNSGFGRDLRSWEKKDKVLPGNVVTVPLVGRNMGHPAVFPTGLPEFFIKLFTLESDTILDPFAGSGSTGVAALSLNRNVVLMESHADYIKVIEDRIKNNCDFGEEQIKCNILD